MSDFESFEILHILSLIQIANRSMYITGKGAITLRYFNMQKNMVEITINDVFFYNDLICQLLSLGAFLQNGFIISGIRDLVTIKTRESIDFMIFQPKMSNDTIYML